MSRPVSDRKTVFVVQKAEPLAPSSMPVECAYVTALIDNSKPVYIGARNVSARASHENGYPLRPGTTLILPQTDLSWWWIDTTVADEGVTVLARVE